MNDYVRIHMDIPGVAEGAVTEMLKERFKTLTERALPHTKLGIRFGSTRPVTPEQRLWIPKDLDIAKGEPIEARESPETDEVIIYVPLRLYGLPQQVTEERVRHVIEVQNLRQSYSMSHITTEAELDATIQAATASINEAQPGARLSTEELLQQLDIFGIFPD